MSDTNGSDTTCYNPSQDEYQPSPDMFLDDDAEASNSIEVDVDESETPTDVIPEWKGVSMDEIHRGLGKFGYDQVAPIVASPRHTVLFSLPLTGQGSPRPYPKHQKDKWSPGYVRMPHSTHSLYPNNHTNGSNGFRQRWEVIQEALLRSFVSSHQLETAILSYNQKYAQRWNFSALHHFFSNVVDEDVTALFCDGLLPKIIQLALQLPALITGPIPLLKRHTNAALSLSQLQIGCLLANAFLCTFPRRNSTNPQSEYAMYPEINFNRLFGAFEEERFDRSEAVTEKLKCIFHYFKRILSKAPEGVITIQRRYIPKENCPRWNRQDARLPPLHITSNGTIETEGAGLLQVDFANKYVGGGVLGWGCVQEEIRFVICPELIATMLVTEALDDTEALIISGIERYSDYEGYSDTFKWIGNFVDETPRDNSGRRRTSIVAIDALLFKQSHTQFTSTNIIRELNKAYVGFSSSDIPKDNLSAIATGNWGCGAFKGDPQLKVLLQLIAAGVAGRPMVYFTFGDDDLRDKVAAMYWHLVERNIDVGRLFILLCESRTSASNSDHSYSDFYHSLYKLSKMKPLSSYFSKSSSESTMENIAGSKSCKIEIFGKSEDTGNKNSSSSMSSTLDSKVQEDRERREIEKLLDDDFFDAEFSQESDTCKIKIFGESKDTGDKNNGSSIRFTSNANVKEDRERQNIEKWLNDDSFDAEFSQDFVPEKKSSNTNVASVKESAKNQTNTSNVEFRNGHRNGNLEKYYVNNTQDTQDCVDESQSQSELPTRPKIIPKERRDLKSQSFPQDVDTEITARAKKPRLSGLEALGKNKNLEPTESQTLEELTSLVKNINDGGKVKKTKQKKISDFFR